jgi:Family of unknown function (DUF6310)
VLVDGKSFDAFQPAARMLWEVKVYNFDSYAPYVRKVAIEKQLVEFKAAAAIANACGYGFTVGVISPAHRDALRDVDDTLNVVVMDWCLR